MTTADRGRCRKLPGDARAGCIRPAEHSGECLTDAAVSVTR